MNQIVRKTATLEQAYEDTKYHESRYREALKFAPAFKDLAFMNREDYLRAMNENPEYKYLNELRQSWHDSLLFWSDICRSESTDSLNVQQGPSENIEECFEKVFEEVSTLSESDSKLTITKLLNQLRNLVSNSLRKES